MEIDRTFRMPDRRTPEVNAANQRMTRIRKNLAYAAEAYADAVRLRDWEVLGYPSLEAWRQHILGYTGLTKAARKEIVGALTEIGMTQREIAAATGASTGTVSNDQRAVVLKVEHKDGEAAEKPQASARQQAARDREASRRTVVVAREERQASAAAEAQAQGRYSTDGAETLTAGQLREIIADSGFMIARHVGEETCGPWVVISIAEYPVAELAARIKTPPEPAWPGG
jgi:DNA-binding CsgD family transcriptional regulator